MRQSRGVRILGKGCIVDCDNGTSLDRLIGDAVDAALVDAGCGIADVDSVVGLGNDADDGGLAPLLKAECAGAWGRSYLHLTGNAGQAISSAFSLAAAGMAARLLVVGWHPGSRPAVASNREMIAEPFYMRPLGATPDALAVLQTRLLIEQGLQMAEDESPEGPSTAGTDAACALVLEGAEVRNAIGSQISIDGCGQSFRSYLLDAEDLDPAAWVRESLQRSGWREGVTFDRVVIGASRSPYRTRTWSAVSQLGLVGGGTNRDEQNSLPDLGPLGGFLALAELVGCMQSADGPASGLVIELEGPVGQSVTALRLSRPHESLQ